ncbi:MAG: alpha-1,4-glucan--maltose-1-phosphate maltosyltransferase [Thermomicrobiales bacterium]
MTDHFTDLFFHEHPPSSVLIEDVQPMVDNGRYPVKREVGDSLIVSADIFRDGHDKLAAVVRYRERGTGVWTDVEMTFVDNDRWAGTIPLDRYTTYEYRVEAFPDVFNSWRDEVEKKHADGQELSSELIEGARILREAKTRAVGDDIASLDTLIAQIEGDDQQRAVDATGTPETLALLYRCRSKADLVQSEPVLRVKVDRVRARYAAWYSMFPRSAGTVEGKSATLRDVIAQLPRIHEMGFNVLYFTPIHPIGTTNRKGKNNTLHALPGDPGVPYGIGSTDGGHDAIEPGLGTFDDFHDLVAAAKDHGMEIALDVAIQASPDHPWALDHPEWFHIRPDGTIKYAENPPKKYQDIYPINFQNTEWQALWKELKRIILHWVEHGVTSFRVDNPHTKPTIFWEWLIAEVQRDHPEVIFLSEAFTRPKVMKSLAKAGFTQSYSYFTWRNFKQEMTDYLIDLTQGPEKEYMRANFFPNTHDILPVILQEGGRPAFISRFTMAATLSSVYGIYSGYEMCENTPVPDREEYLNSEKYDYKVWDWDREGNISDFISRVNRIRETHPALQEYDNLEFYQASDDNVLAYGKRSADNGDIVVILVNMDPFSAHEAQFELPVDRFGLSVDIPFRVDELLTGETFMWTGRTHHWRLDPHVNPVTIFSITPWLHQDYAEPCY